MAKYGKKTQKTVKEAVHKYKRGELKSGKQAIAFGLSEAREKSANVPRAP